MGNKVDFDRCFVVAGGSGSLGYPNARKLVMSNVLAPPSGKRQILFCDASGKVARIEDTSVAKDGSSWGNIVQLETSAGTYDQPCLLVRSESDPDLNYLIAMYLYRPSTIWRYRYCISINGGLSWTGHAYTGHSATVSLSWVSSCIGQDGTVYAFGTQNISGYYIRMSKKTVAGAFGSPVTLPRLYANTRTTGPISVESFLSGGNQCLEAAFIELNNSSIYRVTNVYSSNGGASWTSVPASIDSEGLEGCSYLSLAVDVLKQKVYLAYAKADDGVMQIHFRSKPWLTSNWSAYTRVNYVLSALGCNNPNITIGIDGRIWIAWGQKNKGVTKGPGGWQEILV